MNNSHNHRMKRGDYVWRLKDWPRWRYDLAALAGPLDTVSRAQGRLLGRLVDVGFDLRNLSCLAALTDDVVKTSEIEGERLSVESVRSSIARRLGVNIGALAPADRRVEGVVAMVLDATVRCNDALTCDRLFGWHATLFPTGYSNHRKSPSVGGATITQVQCKWSPVAWIDPQYTSRRLRLPVLRKKWRSFCVGSSTRTVTLPSSRPVSPTYGS